MILERRKARIWSFFIQDVLDHFNRKPRYANQFGELPNDLLEIIQTEFGLSVEIRNDDLSLSDVFPHHITTNEIPNILSLNLNNSLIYVHSSSMTTINHKRIHII